MKDQEKSKDQLIAELIELRRQLADINGGSDLKKMETQLQVAGKFEALGTLAGGIAHDFNNLLMGIQGNTSLILLGTDQSSPNYERLKLIEQLIQSAAGLTRQLLGFTKRGKYEVKTSDLNVIIGKTIDMLCVQLRLVCSAGVSLVRVKDKSPVA